MTPNDALRLYDGEFLDDKPVRSGDIHEPQLRYMLPALVVGAVVALVWMVLAK